jgi:hypothetical protein
MEASVSTALPVLGYNGVKGISSPMPRRSGFGQRFSLYSKARSATVNYTL